ncbi:hypothetical protein CEE58_16205 [Stenotrophomonas maltophilia]|nr:hypothetical protein CEE58_16205 [Stenotrophomonas maltophilia]
MGQANSAMRYLFSSATIGCALLCAVPSAYADFRIVDEPPVRTGSGSPAPGTASESQNEQFGYRQGRPALREVGLAGNREVRAGFGKELPLDLVIQQIAPQGWNTELSPELSKGRLASWTGGKAWTDVLNDVAVKARVYVDLDWSRRSIAVTSPPAALSVATSRTAAGASQLPSVDPKVSSVPTVVVTAPQAKVWVARGGHSLRAVVEEWAASEQVTVIWDAGVDYDMPALMSFRGDLRAALGDLFKVFAQTKRPPKGIYYVRQNLIHVQE